PGPAAAGDGDAGAASGEPAAGGRQSEPSQAAVDDDRAGPGVHQRPGPADAGAVEGDRLVDRPLAVEVEGGPGGHGRPAGGDADPGRPAETEGRRAAELQGAGADRGRPGVGIGPG